MFCACPARALLDSVSTEQGLFAEGLSPLKPRVHSCPLSTASLPVLVFLRAENLYTVFLRNSPIFNGLICEATIRAKQNLFRMS